MERVSKLRRGLGLELRLLTVAVAAMVLVGVGKAESGQNAARVALGQRLFFDPTLSADATVSCSTCHDPSRAFTDGRKVSVGVKGNAGRRNSPTLINAVFEPSLFWDGRVADLQEQAALPFVSPTEMGREDLGSVVALLNGSEDYRASFLSAFGAPPSGELLLSAIAVYERSLISFDSAFDRYIAGDTNAVSASAQRGWELFNTRARCNKCHALSETRRDTRNFSDNDFHNIGIGMKGLDAADLARRAQAAVASDLASVDRAALNSEFSALGRYLVTREDADIGAFRTPNLRNLLLTGPYFHNGGMDTLWDVMDHYNKGAGTGNPHLDEDIQPLALSERDIDDVVAFLASLTSRVYESRASLEYSRQKALSATVRPQRNIARAFGTRSKRPPPPSPLGG
jgi:cytochrome c peroxidase